MSAAAQEQLQVQVQGSVSLPEVPERYTLHTEGTARILLPAAGEAFLNPVQEFNRDLSVSCIRVWSEEVERTKRRRWCERLRASATAEGKGKGKGRRVGKEPEQEKEAKKMKTEEDEAQPAKDVDVPNASVSQKNTGDTVQVEGVATPSSTEPTVASSTAPELQYKPYRFVLLEALSATGLRAIRYAKEIPLIRYVIANDISPLAVEAIRRNVELNEPSTLPTAPSALEDPKGSKPPTEGEQEKRNTHMSKVQISGNDACALLYSHRLEKHRVDCVDLDPYGTAAPFIDAAVQCLNDGGLLCVTCTDMMVLATNNYPEKCFSNYGGIPVKAEYCHEAALRLVLHSISTSAARYGRYIIPLLSLSIDFYVRLFIRIYTSPAEVKKAATKTSIYYICSGCQAAYEQPLGKVVERVSDTGATNHLYRQRAGPPVGERCQECDSTLHVAGPMWSGSLHDKEFTAKVLEHVEANMSSYGTSTRMKGMLTVAKEELDVPFYFTPGRLSGLFHCVSPSLEQTSNALLHAGFAVSRSHALPGSLKTTATRQDLHDVFRSWIKSHPVKPEKISKNSPAHKLHAKEPSLEANFSLHPQSASLSSKTKIVRYQMNPTPHWGPGTRATGKRKRDSADDRS